jgi:hypothetical protein
MEGCRRLADLLARPAGKLLADVLDHFPLARNDLERLGDVFAELGKPRRAAACAGGRARHEDSLARQMRGEWLAHRLAARVRRTSVAAPPALAAPILPRSRLRRPRLRRLPAPVPSDRWAISASALETLAAARAAAAAALAAFASASMRAARSTARSRLRLSKSSGRLSIGGVTVASGAQIA